MNTPRFQPARRALALAAATACWAALGTAQAQTFSPAQFAAACQANPGNTVVLTQPTQWQGASATATVTVPSGCTVVLATGASLELDTLTLRFAGPLVVQGGAQARVSLNRGSITAPRVTLALTGDDGQLLMNESRLASTTGPLALQFGERGVLEVKNSGSWYQPRLAARGRLTLSAGGRFTGSIVDSGVQGARGIGITFNGSESALKIEGSDLLLSSGAPNGGAYTSGDFTVTGSAPKVAFEMLQSNLLEAGQDIHWVLNGTESRIGVQGLTSQTRSQRIVMKAMGLKGEVRVENVLLYASPEAIIESGVQGSTLVTNSPGSINASQLIRVRAGLGGSCSAAPQGLVAPVLQVCR